MKLTPAQKKALATIIERGPISSYSGRFGLNTAYALRKKALIRSANPGALGQMWSPQTNIDWESTPAGREVLND